MFPIGMVSGDPIPCNVTFVFCTLPGSTKCIYSSQLIAPRIHSEVQHESFKRFENFVWILKIKTDNRGTSLSLELLQDDSLGNCSNLRHATLISGLCGAMRSCARLDSTAVSTKSAIKSTSRAHRKARHSSLVTIFCLLLKLFTLQACLLTCFCVHNTNSSNCLALPHFCERLVIIALTSHTTIKFQNGTIKNGREIL